MMELNYSFTESYNIWKSSLLDNNLNIWRDFIKDFKNTFFGNQNKQYNCPI